MAEQGEKSRVGEERVWQSRGGDLLSHGASTEAKDVCSLEVLQLLNYL